MVLIDFDELRAEAGVGEVGTGDRLTAGEDVGSAGNAGIVPAVLGGKSEVLDLGRSARFFSAGQRKAMVIRDRECRAEGCSIPAAWCEADHWGKPWAKGGRTDLADGVLLCSWHHHRADDPAYDGQPTAQRRRAVQPTDVRRLQLRRTAPGAGGENGVWWKGRDGCS